MPVAATPVDLDSLNYRLAVIATATAPSGGSDLMCGLRPTLTPRQESKSP